MEFEFILGGTEVFICNGDEFYMCNGDGIFDVGEEVEMRLRFG